MRHYGRNGNQCAPPPIAADTKLGKCREIGRSVAFGRVTPGVIRWLGLLALVAVIFVGFISMAHLQDNASQEKSPAKALAIMR